MSSETVLAVCVAAAVILVVVAHVLDQLDSASVLTRVGVRFGATGFVLFVVIARFAEALQ